MDSKNVKLSFLILAGLVILSYAFFTFAQENSTTANNIFIDSDQDGLSDQEEKLYGTNPQSADTDGDGYSDGAEIKSGYDPLKPAPGDRIIVPASPASDQPKNPASSSGSAENNLTKTVAQKVAAIAANPDADSQQVTLDQVQGIVDDSLNQTFSPADLPQISTDQIKIKKQNYSKLSAADAAKKKKADAVDYIVAVYYILASNSPKPISSSDTVSGLANSLTSEITAAISQQDPGQLQNLADYGQKIADQLKGVEVPEDMVDTHLKALQFAQYAVSLKDSVAANPDDPLSEIAQYSKLEAFMQALMDFSAQTQNQLNAYGIQLDDSLVSQITSLGVAVPQVDTAATPDTNATAGQ